MDGVGFGVAAQQLLLVPAESKKPLLRAPKSSSPVLNRCWSRMGPVPIGSHPKAPPWSSPVPESSDSGSGQQPPAGRPLSYAAAASADTKTTKTSKEKYQDLVKEAQPEGDIIILQGPKQSPTAIGARPKKLLSQAQWSDLIFDDLALEIDEVYAIDFQAGANHLVEIQLRQGVKADKYEKLSVSKHGMVFVTARPSPATTKVTFRGVPLSLPNAEIEHLIESYDGQIEGEIEYVKEKVNCKGKQVEVNSTTRVVNVRFNSAKTLKTFYWLQGPKEGDQLRRVHVSAPRQGKQCSWCLRSSKDLKDPCRSLGKAAVCRQLRKERTTLSEYREWLARQDNYVSLRQMFVEGDANPGLDCALPDSD